MGGARGSRPRSKRCRSEFYRLWVKSCEVNSPRHAVPCKASGPNRSNHTVRGEKEDRMRNISKHDCTTYGSLILHDTGSHLKMLTNASQLLLFSIFTWKFFLYFNNNKKKGNFRGRFFFCFVITCIMRPRIHSGTVNFQFSVDFLIKLCRKLDPNLGRPWLNVLEH